MIKHPYEILLASSILMEADPTSYFNLKIPDVIIGEGYKDLYEYLHNFVLEYKKIPAAATVKEKFDFKFIKVPETPAYYKDKLYESYKQKTIYSMCKTANDMSKAGDTNSALQLVMNKTSELLLLENAASVINFTLNGYKLFQDNYTKQMLGDDDYIRIGWDTFDIVNNGLTGGDVLALVGRPGCMSGDSVVYVSRKAKGSGRNYTLKQLYNGFNGQPIHENSTRVWDTSRPTYVQSLKDDDLTGLNLVESVISCGIKKTYTVTTSTGKQLRTTDEHWFLTEEGFRPLGELVVGDNIICKAPKTQPNGRAKRPYRKEVCTKMPYSPYPTRIINGCEYQRAKEHRVSYDAMLNGMNINAFVEALKEPNNFVFSPSHLHVHHDDEDVTNNEPDNLKLLTSSDHTLEHCKDSNMRKRFGLNEIHTEQIVSIEYYGEEETYDIECKAPYNNYVANGFVTHNTGKTYLCLYIAMFAWMTQNKPIMFVTMEVKAAALIQRVIAIFTQTYVSDLKKCTVSTQKKKDIEAKLLTLEGMPDFWIVDGDMSSTVDEIQGWANELKPAMVVVDGAYLIEDKHKGHRAMHEKVKDSCEGMKKKVASKYDIPVVLSYQFNRDSTKLSKKDKAGLEHIGGSDAIGQIASIVLGIFQDDTVASQLKSKEIVVLKGREGEVGAFNINWLFNSYPAMNFSEIKEIDKTMAYT